MNVSIKNIIKYMLSYKIHSKNLVPDQFISNS